MRRTIAIASGKGGVGKTWLAISLCHAMASLNLRVLLIDCDVGLANINVQLGLPSGPGFGPAASDRDFFSKAVRTVEGAGFDVLPGRSGSGRVGGLHPSTVNGMLHQLRDLQHRYDAIILDLPSGIDLGVRKLLQGVDDRIVVTTDEPTALTDAYALIKATWKNEICTPPKIIINMAGNGDAGQHTFDGFAKVCNRFLDIKPISIGFVRRDRRVAEAIGRQIPLLQGYPGCDAARDVVDVAATLIRVARSA